MLDKKFAGILGTGSYVPDTVVTNHDLAQSIDTSNEWIIERTGISERRIAKEGECTSDLAVIAAERALQDAGVAAEELDLIIVATVSPDCMFPSVALMVQEKLKAKNAGAFDLTAVCSGFVYGLTIGNMFIKSGTHKKILVIGAETMSRITDWTDRNTAILFGDGAGAVVLGETAAGYGILGEYLGADGAGADLLKIPAGGSRQPSSMETVANRQHFIQMAGNEIFKIAVKIMGEASQKALANAGLTTADVTYLVPHQANIRIIQAAAKRLEVPMERVFLNLNKYGNTSAASIPLALDEIVKSGNVKNGDVLLFVGFGGGLTWGASVIKWMDKV